MGNLQETNLVRRILRAVDENLPFENVGVVDERNVHTVDRVLFEIGEFLDCHEHGSKGRAMTVPHPRQTLLSSHDCLI